MTPKLQEVAAQPWSDGKRVLVSFLWKGEAPVDVEITLFSSTGDRWAQMSVVGLHEPRMDLTLHIRGPQSPGASGLARVCLLKDGAELDARAVEFTLPLDSAHPSRP